MNRIFWKKKKRRQTFQWKILRFFHLVLLSITNLKKHFIWVQEVSWDLFVPIIRYKIVSVRVRYSSENFFKKGYLFVGKKGFGLYFLYSFHQVCQNPVKCFKFCKAFTQICASFKILFVSCKSMLKTQSLEKRAKVQWKKLFGIHLLLSSSLTDFRWQPLVFTLYSKRLYFEWWKSFDLFLLILRSMKDLK